MKKKCNDFTVTVVNIISIPIIDFIYKNIVSIALNDVYTVNTK